MVAPKKTKGRDGSSKRPEKSAHLSAHIIDEQGTESDIEPMDVILGVVLCLAVSTAMYVLLGVVGMPVGGKNLTFEESMRLRELTKERAKKPPALTRREFDEQWKRINDLVDNFVPEYRKHYAGAKRVEKQYYFDCAYKCAGFAKKELKDLLAATKVSPGIVDRRQEVERMLNVVKELEIEVSKENLIVK